MKNNWPVKKLGEVAEFQKGKMMPNSSANIAGSVPYILIDDLRSGNYAHFTQSVQGTACMPVDSLLVWDGANAGTVGGGLQGFVGSTITKISPTEEVNPSFLNFYLSSMFKQFNKQVHGAAIPHLNKGFVYGLPLIIPPLNAQKKIVERLDAIRKAQELCDQQIQKTEELFKSIAFSIFKDGKTYKLGELFTRQAKTILPISTPDQDFNFIGLENIEFNTSKLVNFKICKGKVIKSNKFIFQKGDVLYGKLRPYLNKVWLADLDGICSTDIWALRANENQIKPLILATLLRSKLVVNKMSSVMTGTNLPRANATSFDNLKVMIPNIEDQKKIVEKLEAVQDYKKLLQKQKSLLKELFNSVLNKSMKGKLIS